MQKKVLVIDDTSEIRNIIAETLTLFGFQTLTADDGTTGVDIAQREAPDLIICDVNMPKLDGYGTLTQLRQQANTSTIPFIFLTGAADKVNMRRGMELGADDYLTKPFTHKELMAAVTARLDKQEQIKKQSDQKLDELRGNITLALPHELRTPLHGILGLSSMLMEDYATSSPEEILESARFIHQSALRLHRLIENFLVYSQLELMASEGKKLDQCADLVPVMVKAPIEEVARSVAARFKREADLTLDVGNHRVLVHQDNLKKIVEELVDNAFKFSEAGKPVLVSTEMADSAFHFQVLDHGRGMTAEQIAGIGPHIQFDRHLHEQQGAGLGMVIAKRLVELVNGQLAVESEPGQRTVVRATFPVFGH